MIQHQIWTKWYQLPGCQSTCNTIPHFNFPVNELVFSCSYISFKKNFPDFVCHFSRWKGHLSTVKGHSTIFSVFCLPILNVYPVVDWWLLLNPNRIKNASSSTVFAKPQVASELKEIILKQCQVLKTIFT